MSHIIDSITANLPTKYGQFKIIAFRNDLNDKEDIALVYQGENNNDKPNMVRLHSECMTGDVFGSLKCDCGPQLHKSLEMIANHGKGILLYLRQEGRGIGLFNKIRAYNFQDHGQDTIEANHSAGFEADLRNYEIAADILSQLGINDIILLTNNPDKISQLKDYGINIIEHRRLINGVNKYNVEYLKTKRDNMGHMIKEGLDDVK